MERGSLGAPYFLSHVTHDGCPFSFKAQALAVVATQVSMLHPRNRYPCSCGKSPKVRSSSLPGGT